MWAELEDSHQDREPPVFSHTTVLCDESVALLDPRPGAVYVDATVGGGGHTDVLLERAPGAVVIGIDRDPGALAAASERLSRHGDRFVPLRGAFGDLAELLGGAGFTKVDGILADLGLSSAQLTDGMRGMSFRLEGPLDMRMDPNLEETALDLIARLDQDELANVIFRLGEERRSRRVARCIKLAQQDGRLNTTTDLRRAVVRAVGPARVGGVDPATRTFQALRIAVNGELDQLSSLLEHAPAVLAQNGILAVISFHSLEDRQVKRAFQDRERWERLTKKPVTAGPVELASNPRARSAKLRAAKLLPDNGRGAS